MLPAPAYLLDLSRLFSRLGRGPLTGIDRVELAYLNHFLDDPAPLFALLRKRFGYVLLDRAGCARLRDAVLAQSGLASRPDLHPIARSLRLFLPRMLRKIPKGAVYLNVGHTNLSRLVLGRIARAGMKIAVLIHDTIPLDYPQYSRADRTRPFARKLAAAARFADVVIHISDDARRKTEGHFAKSGRVPAAVTAHLGAVIAAPISMPMPAPYFITIGTIEPRKNHALLLDIWEKLGTGPDVPQLVILGARGWAAPEIFARMDRLIASGTLIHHANMDDGRAMGLLAGARALLFPTHAEGFGLPPIEAQALGVRVIAADLPVLHEVLGEMAVYLDPADSYSWMETIRAVMRGENGAAVTPLRRNPPVWAEHFKIVLTALG